MPGALRRFGAQRWALGALWLLLLAQAVGPVALPGLRQAERWLYDMRLQSLAPDAADPAIVMVDIDEQSLAAHGRWPWPRTLLAELLDRSAGQGGARLVGLDLVLADAERAQDPTAPDRLAEVLRRHPVVLGFHLSNEAGAARIGRLPPAWLPVALLGPQAEALRAWTGHGGNLAGLQAAAKLGAGHLNAVVDDDGQLRRLPMLVRYDGGVYASLSLVMARALLAMGPSPSLAGPANNTGLVVEPAAAPLQALRLQGPGGKLRLPVDASAAALVPFKAPGSHITRISAADLLAQRLAPGALAGKVVLIGVSAPGLIDQHVTPVDAAMSGTEVHAQMLAGLLAGRVLGVPAQAVLIDAASLVLVGALLVWALPLLALAPAVLLTAAVVAALLAANVAAWQAAGLVLPLANGLVLAAGLLGLHLLLAYRQATSARQRLARLFGQYVPPELVDVMSLAPERYTMHGRGAELSVLFADVQGFSGLAERMPPAELGMMMNTVFSHLSDVVHEYRGTLDKFIGDAVMAFWGAPLDDPDHASHAVAAAIAMQQRLPALHAELAARGWPALQIHIGIHSGSMVVGDMGSRHRRAYTVMGDAVNLAARLQALCSEHRLGLLVGEATRRALGPRLCLALGSLPIRGRGAPEQVWHPLPWPAGQNPLADALARDWDRLRAMVDTGRLGEAAALLDALSVQPGMAALCRWQRGRLAASAGPLADRPPALR